MGADQPDMQERAAEAQPLAQQPAQGFQPNPAQQVYAQPAMNQQPAAPYGQPVGYQQQAQPVPQGYGYQTTLNAGYAAPVPQQTVVVMNNTGLSEHITWMCIALMVAGCIGCIFDIIFFITIWNLFFGLAFDALCVYTGYRGYMAAKSEDPVQTSQFYRLMRILFIWQIVRTCFTVFFGMILLIIVGSETSSERGEDYYTAGAYVTSLVITFLTVAICFGCYRKSKEFYYAVSSAHGIAVGVVSTTPVQPYFATAEPTQAQPVQYA